MHQPPDGWDDGLDPAHRTTIASFNDGELSPEALMALLRDDLELQLALARADTRPHLLDWFGRQDVARSDGWQAERARSGPIGAQSVGTEWTWTGVHRGRPGEPTRSFNETAPSGREVVVSGFTIMSVDDNGAFQVRRYVDWAGVFTQLGLTLNWRTPVKA